MQPGILVEAAKGQGDQEGRRVAGYQKGGGVSGFGGSVLEAAQPMREICV